MFIDAQYLCMMRFRGTYSFFKNYVTAKKLQVLDWSDNISILNPIKNLWYIVKNNVAENHTSSATPFAESIKHVWCTKFSNITANLLFIKLTELQQ